MVIGMPITSIKFYNFKTFHEYSLALREMNILVGPNNTGKSTILSAFRVLEQAIRSSRNRRPQTVQSHTGNNVLGYPILETVLPIPLENIRYNYNDEDSRIEFRFAKSNRLYLYFPNSGGISMYWDTEGKAITTFAGFKRAFPDQIQVIPVLGPVEQHEPYVTDQTVRREAGTPRASRHFRNYWAKYPDGFKEFRSLIESTWPGMSIQPPEVVPGEKSYFRMFVEEDRFPRELFWSGFGFQIWCQLLTHISRCSSSDLLVIDEPEIYLHPEAQRQLLGILRDVNPDIILATHSVEIISDADPNDILLIDKNKKSARRLQDLEGMQKAAEQIGSIHNLTLTELARNGKILFVEGADDYKIIKRFAKLLGKDKLATGSGLTMFESEGYGSWKKVQALEWGFRKTIGDRVRIGAIYDRDFRCDEERKEIENCLEREIELAHMHKCKEIENYLLSPNSLNKAVSKAIKERNQRTGEEVVPNFDARSHLIKISEGYKCFTKDRYIEAFCSYFGDISACSVSLKEKAIATFEEKWSKFETRIEMVPGKEILKEFRKIVQKRYSISLSHIRIVDAYELNDVPKEIIHLINRLEEYRKS